ncbi:MAG: Ig-like domain-containing protein [Cellvibrionales bacterium]|nr:Ig-like domain-containing protein [Cellvibrionales bacterium]
MIKQARCCLFLIGIILLTQPFSCSGHKSNSSTETILHTEPKAPTLQKILVTPINSSLHKGQSQQYSAVGVYSDYTLSDISNQVEWKTNVLPQDLSLTNNGLVTAKTLLEAIIEAKDTQTGISGATQLSVSTAILLSMSIEPNPIVLHQGESIKPKLMGYFSDSQQVELTQFAPFQLSTPNYLTQSNDHTLTAKATGETTISITQGGVATSAKVIVSDATLDAFILSPGNISTKLGVKKIFYPLGFYSDRRVTTFSTGVDWSIDKPELASISDQGLVTPIKSGNVKVKATHVASRKIAESTLSILPAKLAHLVIHPQHPVVTAGLNKAFSVIGVYSDNSQADITETATWGILNPTIGNLTPNGTFTATQAGNSIITAQIGPIKSQTTVTVKDKAVTQLEILTKRKRLPIGASKQFKAQAIFNDGSIEEITQSATWQSNDSQIATMTEQGIVLGLSNGETDVSVSFKDKSIAQKLRVIDAKLRKLWIEKSGDSIDVINGNNRQMYAFGLFSNGDTIDITHRVIWVSENPEVFTVIPSGERAGLITAVGLGNAVIRIIDKKTRKETSFALNSIQTQLESIQIQTQGLQQLPLGNNALLKASGTYSNGISMDITEIVLWQSSDENIAEINNQGLITAKQMGRANVSASIGNIKNTVSVEVVNPKAIKEIIILPNHPTPKPLQVVWFTARAIFMDGTELDITKLGWWSSDNWDVASIIGGGVSAGRAWMTGGSGSTTIQMSYRGSKAQQTLTI